MLTIPGKASPGYWLMVDDLTGKADFVMPHIKANEVPVASDWLSKVQQVLRRMRYPIQIEELLRQINSDGLEPSGGGTLQTGCMYLEYTIRREQDWPARFELRCYIETPKNWTEPKFVTAAEVAYIDEKLNRYRLDRANE